jgi:hypothetical protein
LRTNDGTKKVKGYVTDILSEQAVCFVQQRHDQPYCLVLTHPALQLEDEMGGAQLTAAERTFWSANGPTIDAPSPSLRSPSPLFYRIAGWFVQRKERTPSLRGVAHE